MNMRRLLASAVALVLLSGPAFAQGAIQQLGPFTPGHIPRIVGNGLLMDGGAFPLGSVAPGVAVIHQNAGGSCYGNVPCWGNRNMDIEADHIVVQTTDMSLAANTTVSGSPVAGDTPRINVTLNGIPYTFTYTVQPSDTTTLVAAGLAGCLSSVESGNTWVASPGPHCTISPSTFTDDLLALGYITRAYSGGTYVGFNLPQETALRPGLVSAFTATSSGGTTLTSATWPTGFNTDESAFFGSYSNRPGRTPQQNDPAGIFRGGGATTATSGLNVLYGAVKMRVAEQSATAPKGWISLETTASESQNFGTFPRFTCGTEGCRTEEPGAPNPVGNFAGPGGLWVSGPFEVKSPSGASLATISSGTAGSAAGMVVQDAGTNKFSFSWQGTYGSIYDNVGAYDAVKMVPNGMMTLMGHDGGQVTIGSTANAEQSLTVLSAPAVTQSAFLGSNNKGLAIIDNNATAATGELVLSIQDNAATVFRNLRIDALDTKLGTQGPVTVVTGAFTVASTFALAAATPASNAACTPGQWAGGSGYLYNCVASGDWRRVALTAGY